MTGARATCRAVCDERWHNITRSIRLRGAIPMATQEALKQPTWCTLPPDKFEAVVARAPSKLPENILFTYKVRPALHVQSMHGAHAPA